jgi:septum formation protein
MAQMGAPLVLASASPRRRDILRRLGLAFEVRPSGVDEVRLGSESPDRFALRVAAAKAAEVAGRTSSEGAAAIVLGADTVVAVDGCCFGKPVDDGDALAMLRALSGRWHEVTTAVALCRAGGEPLDAVAVRTAVCFRALSDAAMAGYVASGEGRDKAGAYAIQGLGSGLVLEVRGSYDNVVGLPSATVLDLLERHGALTAWP